MTKVILIPCCKLKKPGGKKIYERGICAPALLSMASGEALLNARRDLSNLLGLTPAPDLGSEGQNTIEYLPAYQRYGGNLYKEARLTNTDALWQSGGNVIIVSALYGLVTALEPIRDYDLEMKHMLPDNGRVYTWWKRRQLGVLVHEAMVQFGDATVYDLLSGDYRKALKPWPPDSLNARYCIFDERYSLLRSGSTHHRGMDVRRLLSGG